MIKPMVDNHSRKKCEVSFPPIRKHHTTRITNYIFLINFSLVVSAVYYAKHFLSAPKVMTQIIHTFPLRTTGRLKPTAARSVYERLRLK